MIPSRLFRSNASALLLGGGAIFALATPSWAQPCTPHWDNPFTPSGISSGYVGAFAVYNDGSGETLYAGGSFSSIGTAGPYLAKWNRSLNRWQSLASGISGGFTNAFLTSMTSYNPGTGPELIVAGFFASAGAVPDTKSLARWNGTRWASLGSLFPSNSASSIWALATFENRLIVAGAFSNIGPNPGAGVAAWDGTTWTPLANSLTSVSNNPVVFSLIVFDDRRGGGPALYAAGRFDSIGGTNAKFIAKWVGDSWTPVGAPFAATSPFSDIETMAVFDDGSGNGPELFVGGWPFIPPAQPAAAVAKWNGQRWQSVGANLGGRTTSLAVWDDGRGPSLYAGGTAQPAINYIARLENAQWVPLDGGVSGSVSGNFPSVFAMNVWNGNLVVGGDFTAAGSVPARGLVTRAACPRCVADVDDGSATGSPDGGVTTDDLLYYLAIFSDGNTRADLDNGTFSGTPDGGVTIDDLLFFLVRFEAGC